jgi:hypothetical protein
LASEFSLCEISSITVEKGKMADPFTIVFSDGSGVQLEGQKALTPASLGRHSPTCK